MDMDIWVDGGESVTGCLVQFSEVKRRKIELPFDAIYKMVSDTRIIMTTLTLWQLPDAIKAHIYEYDNTYHDLLKNIVLDNVWRETWIRWYRRLDCAYCRLVFDYLFDIWGVYVPPPLGYTFDEDGVRDPRPIYGHGWSYQWCKALVFPDDTVVTMDFDRPFYHEIQGVYIRVMRATVCMFEGWVLDQHEQSQTVALDNRVMDTLVNDVCWSCDGPDLHLWEASR